MLQVASCEEIVKSKRTCGWRVFNPNFSNYLAKQVKLSKPNKNMADCVQTYLNWAARNNARLIESVGLVMAKFNPYPSLLGTGTWPTGVATVHQILIGRDAAPADPQSIVAPTFVPIAQNCDPVVDEDAVGSTKFDTIIEEFVGRGPGICLNLGIDAFLESYDLGVQALAKLVKDITVADTRYQLLYLSGLKSVMNENVDFYQRLTGNQYALATPFAAGVQPTTEPTFAEIKRLARFDVTELQAPMFTQDEKSDGTPIGENIKVIASPELLDKFRAEIGVKQSYYFTVAGGFKYANKQIQAFDFEGPYQGVGFASDPQPLRLNSVPEDGVIDGSVLIPPMIKSTLDYGSGNVPNPAYWTAQYEIGFIIVGPDSFVRKVPQRLTKLAKDVVFPSAIVPGELKFFVPQGPCDGLQRKGQHWYSIQRSTEPRRPHLVIAFLYKRCGGNDLGYCPSLLS